MWLRQAGPIPLDATLDCAAGAVTALVGPSGSGKSTILRAIAGHYRPREGRIVAAGETWYDSAARRWVPPQRRRAGIVFQSYALFPHMTAAGNVAAALHHLPAAERRDRAAELLALVHLDGLESRRPAELSGGQQQRVAVARALAREPKALLLDEPFSAVDRATRDRLYREVADLRRRLAMPVVLVTHDLQEAAMLADRLVVLHRGTTLQSGAPMQVMAQPRSAEVARLVDMKNLFPGQIAGHEPERERTVIRWGSHLIEARHQPDFAEGTSVVWGLRTAEVILHRRDRPSRGERENPVFGPIVSYVPLGETVSIAMDVEGTAEHHPLHLSVSTHVAKRNGLDRGVRIGVSLVAEGIQLMPAE